MPRVSDLLCTCDDVLIDIAVTCDTPTLLSLAATCRSISRRLRLNRPLWLRKIARLGAALGFPHDGLHCIRASAPVHELIDFARRRDPAVPSPTSFHIAPTAHLRQRVPRIPDLSAAPESTALSSSSTAWVASRRILHIETVHKPRGGTPCYFKSRTGVVVPDVELSHAAACATTRFVFFDILSGSASRLSPDLAGWDAFQMHGTDLLFAEAPRGSAADGRSSRSSRFLVYRWVDGAEDLTLDDSLTASFNDALAAAFGAEALKKRRLSEMGPWADRRYFSAFLCIPESKRVLRALLRLSDDESCFSISACGELTLEKQGNPIQSAGWEAALEYRSLDGSRYVEEGGFVHFPFAEARLRLEGPGPDRPYLCTGNMFTSHAVAAEFYLPLKRGVYLYRLTPPPPDIVDRLNPPPVRPSVHSLLLAEYIPKAAVADGHGRHARLQLVRHVCVAVAGAAAADAESRAVGSNRRCQRQRDARGRRP